jgi:hypothetical protein
MPKISYETIAAKIRANAQPIARQGVIVACSRNRGGRKFGPYFHLAYRDENGRQHSIYIGRCPDTVKRVQSLLDTLKAPLVQRRRTKNTIARLRSALHHHKKQMKIELAKRGLYPRGFSVHGWRKLSRYYKKIKCFHSMKSPTQERP